MAVSYSTGLSETHKQTLPSFRELLPDYLHAEIDSASYHPQAGNNHSAVQQPTPTQRLGSAHGPDLGDGSPPKLLTRKHGYEDSSMPTDNISLNEQSRFHSHAPPLKRQTPDNQPPITSIPQSSQLLHFGEGNRLPPIRDLHSAAEQGQSAYSTELGAPDRRDAFSLGYGRKRDNDSSAFTTHPHPHLQSSPPRPFLGAAPSYSPAYRSSGYPGYQPYYAAEQDVPHNIYGVKSAKYDPLGDSGDTRQKKRRGNLPKPTTDILRAWFHDHLDHPYPSEQDKQMFITRTGLTISQISNWFINARRRQLPALRNQARTSESERAAHRSTPSSDSDRDLRREFSESPSI